jgi:hypothetical protein
MALQTANQFQLGTDFSRLGSDIQQGQKIANQFQAGQERKAALGQAQQATQLSGQALGGNAEALGGLAAIDPAKANQIQKYLSTLSEAERAEGLRENKALTRTSLNALSLPKNQVRAFLTQERERFKADGRNTDIIDGALAGDDNALFQSLTMQAREGQTIEDLANRQFPETKEAKTTSLEKNLVAAGFTPGTEEFQAEVLKNINKPKGTQITIGGEKKFQEAVQKAQAGTFARIGEEADAAIDANQSLSVLESIDVETGALEPAKQGLAAFATAFGLDGSKIANVAKGEGFNAEAKRLVLAVKASQKGPQTDKDESTIRSTVANLGNTKAGNQFIIDSARALNNRRIERKEFYDKFIEDSGGKFKDESGQTADRAWSKFKRNTPMISSNLRTPEGLPVFFYKFESDVRNANPDASRSEIIEAWNTQNKGAK